MDEEHKILQSGPYSTPGKIVSAPTDSSHNSEVRIYRYHKKTGKEYLFKTIKNAATKPSVRPKFNNRNIGANQVFTCRSCGKPDTRSRPNKVRCKPCQKEYRKHVAKDQHNV